MDYRYSTLLKILDNIRTEAPHSKEFIRFHSNNKKDLEWSRGQAFIHLFLLTKFGITNFLDRNKYICDDTADGGLDAYYISETDKTIYLVQSKFKNTASNFHGEAITTSELVKMELEAILSGKKKDSNGINFNKKVRVFQAELNKLTKKQIFKNTVIFLANIKDLNDTQIRKFTEKLDYDVFDFEKCYAELVKPICTGTYYDPDRIVIDINLLGKSAPQLIQNVKTSYGNAEVTLYFVPTKEMGRVMSQYKNAILRYNPRNYLGLSKNPVNSEIRKSITSLSTNDFALFNNGITIMTDRGEFTNKSGKRNTGRLTLINPQIINGGQTAYTLSDIYEKEYKKDQKIFNGKEVLVRVVELSGRKKEADLKRFNFISAISTTTNKQTAIKDADRHSNNPILVSIQDEVFRKYGYFVELKRGEYYDGLERKIVSKDLLIDRVTMLRSYKALKGSPSSARRQSEKQLFDDEFFKGTFEDQASDGETLSSEIFFAFKTHKFLVVTDKSKPDDDYGFALRYGKYAVVYAALLTVDKRFMKKLPAIPLSEIENYIGAKIPELLGRWNDFENKIQKFPKNKRYFDVDQEIIDFDNYYKGTTLQKDLETVFGKG
jgi:hypothetical protein